MMHRTQVVLLLAVAGAAAYQPSFRLAPAETPATRRAYGSIPPFETDGCGSRRCRRRDYRSVFRLRSRRNHGYDHSVALRMGGYFYTEGESEQNYNKDLLEEIGGRIIDKSKIHRIFGVRCIETKHEIATASSSSTGTTVVGLQPLKDLEDNDSSDGTICTDDVEEGRTLSILLDHLFSDRREDGSDVVRIAPGKDDDDDDDDHHHHHHHDDGAFELVELGADPIVSLAAAKLLGGGLRRRRRSLRAETLVVVRHPNEQRLRVLEHAHLFFNEKVPCCSFRTEPLREDDPFVWLPASAQPSPTGEHVVLFTSPALVRSRLDEVVSGIGGGRGTIAPRYRVLVPSAIIAPDRLERYEYRVAAGGDDEKDTENDGSPPVLLEILSSK